MRVCDLTVEITETKNTVTSTDSELVLHRECPHWAVVRSMAISERTGLCRKTSLRYHASRRAYSVGRSAVPRLRCGTGSSQPSMVWKCLCDPDTLCQCPCYKRVMNVRGLLCPIYCHNKRAKSPDFRDRERQRYHPDMAAFSEIGVTLLTWPHRPSLSKYKCYFSHQTFSF